MAIAATINTSPGTQTGNFNATVTFINPVTGFDASKITITAVSGNGITGVTFEVSGSDATYNVTFRLPEDVSGSLSIDITGDVTEAGSSMAESVTVTPKTVVYDNITSITATLGSVEYKDGSVVVVPVTFAVNVVAPSKTVFEVSRVSGDDLQGIEYYITGEDADYELTFVIPADRAGSFQITANGDVLKASSGVWDNVSVAVAKTVSYDTRVPFIDNFDIPANYTPGQKFYVRVAYNVIVTGWNQNNTYTEIFLAEGANLGTPTPYKWTGTGAPDFDTAVPNDLSGTDWQLLAAPPAGPSTPGTNNFDDDGQWHGESGQYFLIEWNPVDANATGAFNLTPRDGGVRGPVR